MCDTNIFVWNNSAVTSAIIQKLSDSKNTKDIYYAGYGTLLLSCSPINISTKNLIKAIKYNNVEFVFSNSQANGVAFVDISCKCGFKAIGSTIKSLKLESSKIYSKQLMNKYNITTADYFVLEKIQDIKKIANEIPFPCFIKADGFAKSLSSIKAETKEDFTKIAKKYLNGYYGEDSQRILVENEIKGIEISIPLVLDSKRIKVLLPVKDYKMRDDNQKGVNTGGMGSYAPIPLTDIQLNLLNGLIKKLEKLLSEENLFYKGFMTINVIFTENDIYLLEINTRLGDSEGQVVLALLDSDIMDLFNVIWNEKLDKYDFKWKKGATLAVNIINKNYPNNRKNLPAGINKKSVTDLFNNGSDIYFYNNIDKDSEDYYQGLERLVSVVETGESIDTIRTKIYSKLKQLEGYNIFYRKDIGL